MPPKKKAAAKETRKNSLADESKTAMTAMFQQVCRDARCKRKQFLGDDLTLLFPSFFSQPFPVSKLEQEKVNKLTTSLEQAVSERAELQRQFDDGEKKTHEFVSHFQHELEKKV
jgi:hypothetical protein